MLEFSESKVQERSMVLCGVLCSAPSTRISARSLTGNSRIVCTGIRSFKCGTNACIDPVLLCNELGAGSAENGSHTVESSGRTQISVKDAVQIARDNNFMGLICSSRLL